jgi:hypothetical protein
MEMLQALVKGETCPVISLVMEQPPLEEEVFTFACWRILYKTLWRDVFNSPFPIELEPKCSIGKIRATVTLRRVPSIFDED